MGAPPTRDMFTPANDAKPKASWYLGLLVLLASSHLVYCGLVSISMVQYSRNDPTKFPGRLNALTATAQSSLTAQMSSRILPTVIGPAALTGTTADLSNLLVLGMAAATVLVLGNWVCKVGPSPRPRRRAGSVLNPLIRAHKVAY